MFWMYVRGISITIVIQRCLYYLNKTTPEFRSILLDYGVDRVKEKEKNEPRINWLEMMGHHAEVTWSMTYRVSWRDKEWAVWSLYGNAKQKFVQLISWQSFQWIRIKSWRMMDWLFFIDTNKWHSKSYLHHHFNFWTIKFEVYHC